jgi:hypothetical protein
MEVISLFNLPRVTTSDDCRNYKLNKLLFTPLPLCPSHHYASRVAVVYAGPTFHDEVASVTACLLHELGFYVVVYIGNGVHIGGMMVPFSGTGVFYFTVCLSSFSGIFFDFLTISASNFMYLIHVCEFDYRN